MTLNANLYVTCRQRITVISERVLGNGRVKCRIRPHRLFNGVDVYRARLIMTERFGRKLDTKEYVSYRNGDNTDDSPRNLTLTTPSGHNRRYKTGSRHSKKSRKKTSATIRRLLAAGTMRRSGAPGERHGLAKLTDNKVRAIRRLRARGVLYREMSERYGVSIQTLWGAATGKTWRHVCT